MEKTWKVKIRYVDTDFQKDEEGDSGERIIIGIPKTEENEEMIRQIFGEEIEIRLATSKPKLEEDNLEEEFDCDEFGNHDYFDTLK